jgi:hypothetical protein
VELFINYLDGLGGFLATMKEGKRKAVTVD